MTAVVGRWCRSGVVAVAGPNSGATRLNECVFKTRASRAKPSTTHRVRFTSRFVPLIRSPLPAPPPLPFRSTQSVLDRNEFFVWFGLQKTQRIELPRVSHTPARGGDLLAHQDGALPYPEEQASGVSGDGSKTRGKGSLLHSRSNVNEMEKIESMNQQLSGGPGLTTFWCVVAVR